MSHQEYSAFLKKVEELEAAKRHEAAMLSDPFHDVPAQLETPMAFKVFEGPKRRTPLGFITPPGGFNPFTMAPKTPDLPPLKRRRHE